MKRKILSLLAAVFFGLIGVAISFVSTNWDALTEKTPYTITIPQESWNMVNWEQVSPTEYLSKDDNQIHFNSNGKYMEYVDLEGMVNRPDTVVQIYYTNTPFSNFSEKKSFPTHLEPIDGGFRIHINRSVERLRIDLSEDKDLAMTITALRAAIDPSQYVLRITNMLFWMILAVVASIFVVIPRASYARIPLYVQSFKKFSYLLCNLIKKDITTKYRRSFLGLIWSILNPLLSMLVISAVFQHIFRFEIENFPLYYLTGSLIFNFVSEATVLSLGSIVSSASLIRKVYIPKYLFPLEKCMFAFVNMLFSMIAILIMFVFMQFTPSWTILLLWVSMVYTLVFCIGLGMILASINVFFRDIGHLYTVWVGSWIYLTPIIYPIDILPEFIKSVVKCNPLYYYVEHFRMLVLYGTFPDFRHNLICVCFSAFFLVTGLAMFKKTQDRFILYL